MAVGLRDLHEVIYRVDDIRGIARRKTTYCRVDKKLKNQVQAPSTGGVGVGIKDLE